MGSGNHYAPEDALIPGGFALGEGAGWAWSAVVNSALQPILALRWLFCYEESDVDRVHLPKAAPKNWFAPEKKILVNNCPTRFGHISWSTESQPNTLGWTMKLDVIPSTLFTAETVGHIHPPNGRAITSSTVGRVSGTTVVVPAATLAEKGQLSFRVL
jgi:hypothetical protein